MFSYSFTKGIMMSIHFRLTCWNPNQKYRTNIFINYLIWIFKRMRKSGSDDGKEFKHFSCRFSPLRQLILKRLFRITFHLVVACRIIFESNRVDCFGLGWEAENLMLTGKKRVDEMRQKNDADNIGEWRKNYNLIVIKIENVNRARAVMSVIIIWLDALIFHTIVAPKECCKQFNENVQRNFSVSV